LDADTTSLREQAGHRPLSVAALAEIAEGDGEPKVREEKVERGVVVGAMSASGLLRLNELRMVRIDRLSVVGDIVEVDGDIHGAVREEGMGLFSKSPGDGALGAPEVELSEKSAAMASGRTPSGVGAGSGHGRAASRRSEDQIGGVPTDRRREGASQSGGQQGSQPEMRLAAHLTSREHPPSATPVGRWVFLSMGCSLSGRKTGAAACGPHTNPSRRSSLERRAPPARREIRRSTQSVDGQVLDSVCNIPLSSQRAVPAVELIGKWRGVPQRVVRPRHRQHWVLQVALQLPSIPPELATASTVDGFPSTNSRDT